MAHPPQLVAVTKSRSQQQILQLLDAGVLHLGENRLQEIEKKYDHQLFTIMKKKGVLLHFIGSVQGNKVSKLVRYCDVIQTVDSLRIAVKIDQVAREQKKRVPIFLQLNLTGENHKQGISDLTQLPSLIGEIQKMPSLHLMGFMCMGKQDDMEATRVVFKHCKELARKYDLPEVSMGMSSDYEIALEEGSTMIRIGNLLFENPERLPSFLS